MYIKSYTNYPIKATSFKGHLKSRNSKLAEIEQEIDDNRIKAIDKPILLLKIGDRSVWS
ncbi:MAG TPA: hypothetical protein VFJ51_11985 [Nitrososphaeraceae archaeon]|nr:hypothetical protein [Nitrososphaeraceae archaeon]